MVDSPRDMRFLLTARTLAFRRKNNMRMNDITAQNVKKVTAFRKDGVQELRRLVGQFERMKPYKGEVEKIKVYPDPMAPSPKAMGSKRVADRKRLDPFPWK
jgi:large subunit ribosomal protein L17